MIGTSLRRDQSLRVAINAQILPNRGGGGVESVLIGLIHALGHLDDGPEEYIIIGHWQNPEWLKPYIGPNQRIVWRPKPPQHSLRRILGPLRPAVRKLRNLFRQFLGINNTWPEVPISDGFYESLGCDVIHFPSQYFVVCALPMIYNPHDLQHLHYPQFFTPSSIVWRETIYPAGCHFAHTVVVASQWVKEDIVRHYRLHPDKIQVIPWAPPTQAYPEPSLDSLEAVRKKYCLEEPFALYPSMTWPHKNHIRLLEVLALLRDREGLKVYLVCTGHQNSFWPHIQKRLLELRLQDQVKFLGMVPPEDLRAIYRLAQFAVIPTLFEAVSGPLFEAWQEGVPVACSAVTSLPEQASDAALLFDPFSVKTIAEAVARMVTEPSLREELQRRGAERLKDFSWERTAKAYRAVYRRAAGRSLTEEDWQLLSWDWMRESQRKKKA